jgi:hypothetical protein
MNIISSVADPRFGAFLFDPGIRDITESLETVFGLKILKCFDADADPEFF